jgi:hypothetical protein
LVIIGYSFAPTDFHTRRLFREAFAENDLEELIVVNPNAALVSVAKELTHFNRPVLTCRDLEEYVAVYGPHNVWNRRSQPWNGAPTWEPTVWALMENLPEDQTAPINFGTTSDNRTLGIAVRVGMLPVVGQFLVMPIMPIGGGFNRRAPGAWFRVVDMNEEHNMVILDPAIPSATDSIWRPGG